MSKNPLFETITDDVQDLAIFVRAQGDGDKYNFPTAPENPLQMGVSFYKQGEVVQPHAHYPRRQIIRECQEMVVIQKGKAVVTIYTILGEPIAVRTLETGDAVLFLRGGHAISFDSDTRVLEVKQGPYVSRADDKFELSPRREAVNA